jgi:prephenate dehydrogenase
MLPDRIAILGPGLLGGSLLMALRERLPEANLRAWARRQESVDAVLLAGLADLASTDVSEVVKDAELIIICSPVEHMAALASAVTLGQPSKGCVVTDVGSVKAPVVSALEDIFNRSGLQFVGSHPMAGSERAGLEAARADLFAGQACLVTPTLFTADSALKITRAFWQLLGCRVLEMTPEEHDRNVARISHLPHVMAATITLAALQEDFTAARCIGKGFRDTTRVSAGDPDLWTGILLQNRAEVLQTLADTQARLSELLAILENVDEVALRRYLREAKMLRDAVPPAV